MQADTCSSSWRLSLAMIPLRLVTSSAMQRRLSNSSPSTRMPWPGFRSMERWCLEKIRSTFFRSSESTLLDTYMSSLRVSIFT